MIRAGFGICLLLTLCGPAAAENQLFDLTLNRVPTTEEFQRLNELVEVPNGFLETVRRDGFAQRVVPIRPGVDLDKLLSLGEVPGVAFAAPEVVDSPFGDGSKWTGGAVNFEPLSPLSDPGIDAGQLYFASDQLLTLKTDDNSSASNFLPGPTLLGPGGSLLLFPDSKAATALLSSTMNTDPGAPPVWSVTVPKSGDAQQPGLAAGSINSTTSRMSVTQGLPEGLSVVQETAGNCTSAAPPDWPFSVVEVTKVIDFGNSVLAEAMLDPPVRARILVVDSGLPAALLENGAFRRLLDINRREAMGAGAYSRNAEEASIPKGCRDLDRDNGASFYGFVPLNEDDENSDFRCQPAEDPLLAIAPPLPDKPTEDYDPAHGALVAGLSAGGPDLIQSLPGLQSHLAVAMARIARREMDGTTPVVASSVNDALGGIARAATPFDGSATDPYHAQARRFDILNLSLSLAAAAHADAITGALSLFIERGGLVVVAAGNGPPGGAPLALDHFDLRGVPAPGGALAVVLGATGLFDGAIVVGGTAPGPTGVVPYERSNWSPRIVDIAAPATGVISFGLDGTLACAPGTSIATPQVSFIAAMLVSFGLWDNSEVKRRILATADIVPALADRVRDGRVLNPVAALDVFADLVWKVDASSSNGMALTPLRVRIADRAGNPNGGLIELCADGSEHFVDSREMVLWERRGTQGRLWRARDGGGITDYSHTCLPSSGASLSVIDIETGKPDTIAIDDIARIVPSRFRLGDAVLRAAATKNP